MLRNYLSIFTLLAATATAVTGIKLGDGNHIGRSPARRHPFGHAKSDLMQRGDDARFTWYVLETGNQVACGGFRNGGEWIVALNSAQFGGYPSPNCGRSLTISYRGRTVQATVQDECPTCPHRGLDLSQTVFGAIASLGDGEIYGDWWWDGEGPQPPPHSEPPPPPPSPTPTPEPPTTSQTPTPTPSPTPSPSPTSSSSDPGLSVKSEDPSSSAPTPSSIPQAIGDLSKLALQIQGLLVNGFEKYSQ